MTQSGREESRARSAKWMIAATVGAVLLGLIVAFGMLGKSKSQQHIPEGTVVASTVAPSQMARLGLNAYPWGEVLSIRNLDNGKAIELSERIVTPAGMDLPPGRYEIVLSNPASQPSTQVVTLAPGASETIMVQFEKPKDFPPLEGSFK